MGQIAENKVNPVWVEDIYQIEMTDPVVGGSEGIANKQAKQLAERTQYLKKAVEGKAESTRKIATGNGLSGGGDLTRDLSISLTQATESDLGGVKLVDGLDSDDGESALSARQGKIIDEKIENLISQISVLSAKRKNHEFLSKVRLKLSTTKALNIVCVGDSITYGYDIYSTDKLPPLEGHTRERAPIQYPMQLQSELRRILGNDNTTVKNYGFSGDTAETSFKRAAWQVNPDADIAFLMLGLNDQSKKVPAETYCEFMGKWIERLLSWGTAVVLLISTPRSSGAGSLSDAYRQAAKQIAEMYGCPIVDTTAYIQAYAHTDIYSDITHFNKEGYRLLGNQVAWALLKDFNDENQSNSFIYLNSANVITSAKFVVSGGEEVSTNTSKVKITLSVNQEVHLLIYCQNDNNAVYFDGVFASGTTVNFDSDGLAAKPYLDKGSDVTSPKTITLSSVDFAGTNLIYVGQLYGRGYHVITIRAAGSSWLSAIKLSHKDDYQINDVANKTFFYDTKKFMLMSPLMKTTGTLPALSTETEITLPKYLLSELTHPRWFIGGTAKIKILAARNISNLDGGLFYSCAEYDVFPINGSTIGIHTICEKFIQQGDNVTDDDIVKLLEVRTPLSIANIKDGESKLILKRNKACFVKIFVEVIDVPAVSLGGFLA